MAAKTIRCAIYTRKSSEEGLEQAFNSLDAQREACAAYIQSQKHEGWTELSTEYDDGGISGGTLQRPALRQLLADIQAGRIDTVVVYKVDRLTRSLADFAKIVEVLDAQGVSFVSVTQQFNTTTSMGRLTLNMLLSFAQFEREVTGERIRDKIAASKRKGMWMGGLPPLGYDAIDRQLQVNQPEAEAVRHIFWRYTELGSVDGLRKELAKDGIVNKVYLRQDSAQAGIQVGRKPLLRGTLYRMLQNPLYQGRIRHRSQVYPGQHPAIIGDELWRAVQAKLEANRIADAHKTNAKAPSLLAGKRYRYYVSRPAQGEQHVANRRWRIPAGELEGLVITAIRDLLNDAKQLRSILSAAGAAEIEQHHALDRAMAWSGRVTAIPDGEMRTKVRDMITGIVIADATVTVNIAIPALFQTLTVEARDLTTDTIHEIALPVRLQRTGMEMRLIDERTAANEPDSALVRLLAKAWTIRQEVLKGDGRSLDTIAQAQGIGDSYLGRLLRIGFLAPDIIETILQGKQPPTLTANRLAALPNIPTDWNEQERVILA